jgi:hypothetical protein
MQASVSVPARRETFSLSHDIYDPLRHHDYTLWGTALKCALDGLQRKYGSFDLFVRGIAGNCHVGALLAINLDR